MDNSNYLGLLISAGQIGEAKNSAEAIDVFCECLKPFGLRYCLISGLPIAGQASWRRSILVNRWPGTWFERYNDAAHYGNDPCVARVRSSVDPFYWSDVELEQLAPAQRLVMAEAREFGLKQGICVPIALPDTRQPATVTVSGEFVDLPPKTLGFVQVLAQYVFAAASRQASGDVDDAPSLSPREREVLHWMGAGKTAWETACILGLSEYTVHTHLRNARDKLGAVNTTHTVVEALRRHEIKL